MKLKQLETVLNVQQIGNVWTSAIPLKDPLKDASEVVSCSFYFHSVSHRIGSSKVLTNPLRNICLDDGSFSLSQILFWFQFSRTTCRFLGQKCLHLCHPQVHKLSKRHPLERIILKLGAQHIFSPHYTR